MLHLRLCVFASLSRKTGRNVIMGDTYSLSRPERIQIFDIQLRKQSLIPIRAETYSW